MKHKNNLSITKRPSYRELCAAADTCAKLLLLGARAHARIV